MKKVLGDDVSTHLVNKTVPDRVLDNRKTSAGVVNNMVVNTGSSTANCGNSIPSSSAKNGAVFYHHTTHPQNEGNLLYEYTENVADLGCPSDSHTDDVRFESCFANTAIPMSVWSQRFQCKDFVQCVAQNGSDFWVCQLLTN